MKSCSAASSLFEPNLRIEIEKRVDRAWWAPACGRADYDIARTAQGNWFLSLEGNLPGDHNLALVSDPRDPNVPVFSTGSRIPGLPVGIYSFTPRTTGRVNRRFHDISADQSLFCYEDLQSLRGNHAINRTILLLSVSDGEVLHIEAQENASCGPEPWQFADRVATFVR